MLILKHCTTVSSPLSTLNSAANVINPYLPLAPYLDLKVRVEKSMKLCLKKKNGIVLNA